MNRRGDIMHIVFLAAAVISFLNESPSCSQGYFLKIAFELIVAII